MQLSKVYCGIDIGTQKITTIVGQYFESESRLNVIAVSSTESYGFKKGQISDLEQAASSLSQSLESATRMAGLALHDPIVSISAPYIESINSKGAVATGIPNNEILQSDIDRAIDASRTIALPTGKEILHAIPRTFTVDDQTEIANPVGMNGLRLEVETHLILASSPALKNLKKCLELAKIAPKSIVFSGLPTAKACLTETEKDLGVALVDIGGSITTITIFTNGFPSFSSVIPVGSSNITNDLVFGLRLNPQDAENFKIKLEQTLQTKGFNNDVEYNGQKLSLTTIQSIINPRLEEIFKLINDKIITSGFQQKLPSGLVLTGGGSQTAHIKDVCGQIISLPVRIAFPPKIGGIVEDIINPSYSSAIGLLMYATDEERLKKTKTKERHVPNFGGIFGKIKSFLEPILP